MYQWALLKAHSVRRLILLQRLKFWVQNQLNPHAHLLQFYTLYLDPTDSRLTISTEKHDGNVLDYIASNPDCDRFVLVGVSYSTLLSYWILWHYHQLHDLLMGLNFLHQHNFVHGDIRAVSYLEFLSCTRPLTACRIISSWNQVVKATLVVSLPLEHLQRSASFWSLG